MSLFKKRGSPRVLLCAVAAALLAMVSAFWGIPSISKASASEDGYGILSAQLEKGACFGGDITDPPALVVVTYRGAPVTNGDILVNNYGQNDHLIFTGQVEPPATVRVYASGTVTISLGYVTDAPGVYPITKTVTVPDCNTPVTKPTVNLKSSATSVTVGDSIKLSWTSTNAVSLMASGDWSGSKAVPSGNQTVTPSAAGMYIYNLTATGPGGTASAKPVTVTVKDKTPPPTCQSDLSGVTGTVSNTANGSVTYTATLPKPACSSLMVYGDTYTLPSTYDGSGNWNASASPQYVVSGARAVLVIAKGQTSATATRSFAQARKCGTSWFQDDVYTGPQQDTVTYPQGSNGYLAGGPFKVVYNGPECQTPPPPTKVTATAPTSVDKCGIANDTYSIPSVKGVDYYVNGEVVSTGTHSTKGALSVKVTAKAENGYKLEGKSSWVLKFTDEPCVTPPTHVKADKPKAKDSCGTANDAVVIPSTKGVDYQIDGKTVSGTVSTGGALSVTVSAVAQKGYVLDGQSSWTFTFTDKACPEQPEKATITPECGYVLATNPNKQTSIDLLYGSRKNSGPDGSVTIKPGETVKVETKRTSLDYVEYVSNGGVFLASGTVKVKQDCNTTPPTSPTTKPTSPTGSPTSPTTQPTSPSSPPSSTSPGTPTSTSTAPSPTSTNSTKPGKPSQSNSSTATSTSKGSWTSTSSSKTTGPPIVTDGPAKTGGSNNGLVGGLVIAALGLGVVGWGLRRRLSN